MAKLYANGEFQAKAVHGQATKTKRGVEQFAIEFELLAGPNQGEKITWYGGFDGQGFEFSTKTMQLAGWDGKTNPLVATYDQEVSLVIQDETYVNGKGETVTHSKVKYVNAPGSSFLEKQKLEAGDEKSWLQGFAKKFQSANGFALTKPSAAVAAPTPAKNGKAKKPAAPPPDENLDADPPEDDNIPF